MYLIIRSAYVSLVVQLIIGLLGLHGIFIELQQKDHILNHIMIMETTPVGVDTTEQVMEAGDTINTEDTPRLSDKQSQKMLRETNQSSTHS